MDVGPRSYVNFIPLYRLICNILNLISSSISLCLYTCSLCLLFRASSEPNFRKLQIIFSLSLTQLSPLYIMSLRRKSTYCIPGKNEKYRKGTISSAPCSPCSWLADFHLGINTLTLGATMAYLGFLCVTCSGPVFPVQKRAGRNGFESGDILLPGWHWFLSYQTFLVGLLSYPSE